MKIIEKFSHILDLIMRFFMTFLLVVMSASMFLQIISRPLLDQGITGLEELAKYSMIWMVFIAAAVAAKDGTQMKMDVLENKFPRLGKVLLPIQHIFTLIYIYLIVTISFNLLEVVKHQNSPNMGVSMSYVYMIFPIAFTVMAIHIIVHLLTMRKKKANDGLEGDAS